MKNLVIVPFGSVPVREDGCISLTDKFTSGLTAYQERWPGSVHVVAKRSSANVDGNLGGRWSRIEDLPFHLSFTDDLASAVISARPSLVLGSLEIAQEALASLDVPVVFVAENPGFVHEASLKHLARGIPLWRGLVGLRRREKLLRKMIATSAGVQCNGFPAWDAYRRLNPSPMLFFDSRVPLSQMEGNLIRVQHQGPLRLGFSGRLLPIKGAQYLPRLMDELDKLSAPAYLRVFGSGPLEAAVTSQDAQNMKLEGVLEYPAEWTAVISTEIDLMVLPHVLGDPSGTFLETMACGVPLTGFDSAALSRLTEETGCGWTVPVGDVAALAERIATLTPGDLAQAGASGRTFMAGHSSEAEFDRRVEHLLRVESMNRTR